MKQIERGCKSMEVRKTSEIFKKFRKNKKSEPSEFLEASKNRQRNKEAFEEMEKESIKGFEELEKESISIEELEKKLNQR